jgi:UDP-N-acetylmuramyl tripeptide synthase
LVAARFSLLGAKSTVHPIESKHAMETHMDLLNSFFAFNALATASALVAFATMREPITAHVETAKAKLADVNVAGLGGAATSLVLLASVAHLFQ